MDIIKTKVKRFKNSFVAVIPTAIIEEKSIKENQTISVILMKEIEEKY